MRKLFPVVIAVASLTVPLLAGKQPKSRVDSAATIARGKYLVGGIAMCGDCHTPRTETGERDSGRWLKGATLGFRPTASVPVWADTAPNIAGLPGWDQDQAMRYLMTGIGRNHLPSRPPMPQFRFNLQDAKAIVAYLRSLGAAE